MGIDELEVENARLRDAIRTVRHYFDSPKSYSETEVAFVVRVLDSYGKCLTETED